MSLPSIEELETLYKVCLKRTFPNRNVAKLAQNSQQLADFYSMTPLPVRQQKTEGDESRGRRSRSRSKSGKSDDEPETVESRGRRRQRSRAAEGSEVAPPQRRKKQQSPTSRREDEQRRAPAKRRSKQADDAEEKPKRSRSRRRRRAVEKGENEDQSSSSQKRPSRRDPKESRSGRSRSRTEEKEKYLNDLASDKAETSKKHRKLARKEKEKEIKKKFKESKRDLEAKGKRRRQARKEKEEDYYELLYQQRLKTIRASLNDRNMSLSRFAPGLLFYAVPLGTAPNPIDSKCEALKNAALLTLRSQQCYISYLNSFEQCRHNSGFKHCVKAYRPVEAECAEYAFRGLDELRKLVVNEQKEEEIY